jgi:3-ketosteroid 9alpha-monooxygenase subunit B
VTETATLSHARFVTVARVIEESVDAVSLVLAVEPDDRDRFVYQPGQFLTLRIPSERAGSVSRCYSIASSPFVDTELKVTVKRTANGYGSNWLCDNAAEGHRLQVLPPGGVFVPKSLSADFLLFAGGSGITPIMSILKSALSQGSGRIVLVYANRDAQSVIFADELRRMAARYPKRLVVLHWVESIQGLPVREQLQQLAAPYADFECFTCGPGPFMDAVTEALTSLGVPRDRRRSEVFTSLSGDPFAEVPVALPTSAADVESVTARVRLDGAEHELAWPAGIPLVDLLLGSGIDAPYSCREGECGSCTAQVTVGRTRMLHNEVLDPSDVADGYILGCQAVADGTDVEVAF